MKDALKAVTELLETIDNNVVDNTVEVANVFYEKLVELGVPNAVISEAASAAIEAIEQDEDWTDDDDDEEEDLDDDTDEDDEPGRGAE